MISKDSTNLNAMRRINRRTFLKMAGAATGAIAFGGLTTRLASGNLGFMYGEWCPFIQFHFSSALID